MISAWLDSPSPGAPAPDRVHQVCEGCNALIFGATEKELTARVAAHRERHHGD